MSWTLRHISHPQDVGPENLKPGDWWFCPWFTKNGSAPAFASDDYVKNHLGRRPMICIRLPGGTDLLLDGKEGAETGQGFVVAGGEGCWSAAPAIAVPGWRNAQGKDVRKPYHGYLTNGILSDDVDGREYG